MKQELTLFLNDERVVISQDSTVAMSYAVHDLNNMESRNGGSSNEFQAPKDPNRNSLQTLWDSQSASNLPYTALPARLESRGVPIPCGTAEVTTSADRVSIRLQAGNTTLWQQIKGRKLSDLDLSEFDVLHSSGYDVSAFGEWLPIETNRTMNRPNLQGGPHFAREELTLAVYAPFILGQIIRQAGFIPQGSFFSYPEFLKQVVVNTNGLRQFRESYREAHSAEATTNGTTINYVSSTPATLYPVAFPIEVTDPGAHYSDPEYTASIKGDYHIQVKVLYDWTSTPSPPVIRIRTATTVIAEIQLAVGTDQVTELEGTIREFTGIIYVDTYVAGTQSITFKEGSTFAVKLGARQYNGEVLHPEANLPELSQVDFVKDLANQYCLIFNTSEEGRVTVERMADVVNKIAVDWSKKIDMAVTPTVEYKLADYAQNNLLTFSEDSDAATEEYSLEPGDQKPGRKVWHSFPVFNSNLQEERTAFVSPFAATGIIPGFTKERPLPYIPSVDITRAVRFFIPGASYSEGQYIFHDGYHYFVNHSFTASLYNITPEEITTSSGINPKAIRTVYPGKARKIKPRKLFVRPARQDLYLVAQNGEDTKTRIEVEGTFDGMDWKTQFTRHYGPLAGILSRVQLVKCNVRLNAIDIQNLPFTTPVWIDQIIVKGETFFGGYYYLNTIEEYLPGTDYSCGATFVKLN